MSFWDPYVSLMTLQVCHPSACLLSHFTCVRLFVTPWTVSCQAPLSMGSSRQEYWSGLPCPPPRDLPDPGIEPVSHVSCIAGGFFTTSATQEALSSQGSHLSGHRAAPHPEASEYKGISAVPGSQGESIPRQLRPGGGARTHRGRQGHNRCYHKGLKSYHRTKRILPKGNHNS